MRTEVTRRAFFGTVAAAAAVPRLFTGEGYAIPANALPDSPVGTTLELHTDLGADTWVRPEVLARHLHRRLDRRTRDLGLRAVGGFSNKPGYTWGSGYFEHKVFALVRDWPWRGRRGSEVTDAILYDRVFVEDLVGQLDRQLRLVHPKVTGRLEVPSGTSAAYNIVNARLVMRFVAMYELPSDSMTVRADVLSG